jgi:hypothetical protein
VYEAVLKIKYHHITINTMYTIADVKEYIQYVKLEASIASKQLTLQDEGMYHDVEGAMEDLYRDSKELSSYMDNSPIPDSIKDAVQDGQYLNNPELHKLWTSISHSYALGSSPSEMEEEAKAIMKELGIWGKSITTFDGSDLIIYQ